MTIDFKTILEILKNPKVQVIIAKICSAVKAVISFLKSKKQEKKEKEAVKNIEEYKEKAKDVANNGNLNDLLNLKHMILICLFVFSGCANTIKIEACKPWEGHYYTYSEFTNATINIKLDKKESIWVLSNQTLERVLTNNK